MNSFQDGKYGSSPTSSSSSSVGVGPFNSSLGSRTGTITDPSFPYFPPPFNPAFAAQFDVHAAAAASAIEHYPSFNYAAAVNGSSTSSSPYGAPSAIHHQHPSQSTFNNGSYDPYASAYVAARHHSILDAHHHHHPAAAELYARHNPHHQTSANSLVDHTARVSIEEDLKRLDLVHRSK